MPRPNDTPQNALDLLILKTLAREANHGFAITLHIQTVSEGLLRVEEGSLYPALHRLERDKLVESEWRTTPNGRRARYYKLTEAGSQQLAESQQRWNSLAQGVAKVIGFA